MKIKNFDSMTGAYLPAPHKAVKEVKTLSIIDDAVIIRTADDEYLRASVVSVVIDMPNRIVVETKNSVYAGEPRR